MHPFCLRHLPRRGRFALHSAFVLISISKHNAAPLPPPGEVVRSTQRGAFPSRRRRGCMVFHSAERNYKTHRRQAIPSPLNLLNPLDPLNLHAAGVSKGDTITLGPEGPIKPKNLKNLRPARAVNPHARRACPICIVLFQGENHYGKSGKSGRCAGEDI